MSRTGDLFIDYMNEHPEEFKEDRMSYGYVPCTECGRDGKGPDPDCEFCGGQGRIFLCPHHGGECMLNPTVEGFKHYGWWCDECNSIVDPDDQVMGMSLK